jgi:hypothetical protein
MDRQKLIRIVLWTGLAATLGSAILAPSEEAPRRVARGDAASGPAPRGSSEPSRPQAPAPVAVLATEQLRPSDGGMVIDLFQPRKPPPAAPSVPAKPPAAPPVPFQYMGSVEKQGALTIYLVHGDKFYELSVGESFGQNYRLDSIGAEGLTITYLPLDIQQVVATGGAR